MNNDQLAFDHQVLLQIAGDRYGPIPCPGLAALMGEDRKYVFGALKRLERGAWVARTPDNLWKITPKGRQYIDALEIDAREIGRALDGLPPTDLQLMAAP